MREICVALSLRFEKMYGFGASSLKLGEQGCALPALRPLADALPHSNLSPIVSAAIMLRTFLRLWGVIVVLRLREFEIPTFQICGGKNFKVLSRIQKPDKKIPVISHKK